MDLMHDWRSMLGSLRLSPFLDSFSVILQEVFVVMDLTRKWRCTPGSLQLLLFLDRHLLVCGYVARARGAAVLNGALSPGKLGLHLGRISVVADCVVS